MAQGCPLSPFVFNMIVDPWLRAMEKDPKWDGLRLVPQRTIKVMAFSDDKVLVLSGLNDYFIAVHWIELFQLVSGARINWDKSCLWGLGPWSTNPPHWTIHPYLQWREGTESVPRN